MTSTSPSPNDRLKPIVLCITAASSYRLLRMVAEYLLRSGRCVIYLFDSPDNPVIETVRQEAAAMGIDVHAIADTVGASWTEPVLRGHPRPDAARKMDRLARLAQAPRPSSSVGSLLVRLLWRSDLMLLRRHREQLGARLAAAVAWLRKVEAAAVVVSEDGIAAPLPILTAARHLGVAVIDVPYGYGVRRDLELALQAKAQRHALITLRGLCGAIVRWLAPQWIKQGEFAGAIMYPAPYIVAAESLGMTLRDAWIVHGGYSDRLCAESAQMRDLYLSEGVPAEKLILTGTPYCDTLLSGLALMPEAAGALRQPRKIRGGRTRILVAWPPSYHDERGGRSEFATYREMSVAILGWLASLDACDVTVSLHPATLDVDRAAVEATGVTLTQSYVIELIAAHDIFITYFSSTIRWAIAAGKPVVNYDAYKLGLDVYRAAPGVFTVDAFSELQRLVLELSGSDDAFRKAAGRQIEVAEYWGTLDGSSTARVAETICG
jgi:hypothetical protein